MEDSNSGGDVHLWQELLNDTFQVEDEFNSQASEGINEALMYRMAAETADIGTWNFEASTMKIVICRIMSRVLGLPSKRHQKLVFEWKRHVHHDDFPAVREALRISISSKKPFSVEHRICRVDGRFIWLLTRGRFIQDGNGKSLRVIGACLDVTWLALASNAITNSQRLVRTAYS
jgi:PAS domain S-box-containing protein